MSQTPESSPSPLPWSTRHKGWLIGGIIALALIIIIAVTAIYYVRSGRLNRYIVTQVQTALAEYGLRAEVGELDLVWGIRTAKVRDVKIYNAQTDQLIATIEQAELVVDIPNPYALRLRREIIFKRLDLDNLQAYVDLDEQGNTNFSGIHSPPPSAPSRITFDFSSLIGSIKSGTVHLSDKAHQLSGELGKLQANAQPVAGESFVTLQLNASEGRINIEGRETTLDALELIGRLSETSAEVERLTLHSPVGAIAANGRLDDWNALRYNFDTEAQVNLDEVERVVAPEMNLQGDAQFKGNVNGEGKRFKINGALSSGELIAETTRLRGANIQSLNVESDGTRINFSGNQLIADAINVEANQLSQVRAGALSGEYVDGRTQASIQRATASGVKLSQGQLSELALNNIRVTVENGRTQANAQQATISQATLAEAQFAGTTLQNISATIAGGRTEARVQQVNATRLDLEQGQLAGLALRDVVADLRGEGFEVTAGLTLDGGKVSGATVGETRGQLTATNRTLALSQFTSAILGGTATGDASLQIAGNGESRVTATLTDVKTGELFSLAEVKDDSLTGNVNAQVDITFPGTQFDLLSGQITAHLTGETTQTTNAIPVNGDVSINAQSGTFNVEQLTLATPASQLTATGQLSSKGNSDLNFSLTSTNAEELQTIAYSIEDVQKSIADYKPRLAGAFTFSGRVTGKLADPVIEGDVDAAEVGLREQTLGSLTGHVRVSPTDIAFENGTLAVADGGTAKFTYAAPRAEKATAGRLDATLNRVNVAPLATAAGLAADQKFISGALTGEAHLTGLPDAPTGTATVNLLDGTLAGQTAQLATANLVFDGRSARLERSEIRLAQGQLTATGTLDLKSNDYQLQGNAGNIDLGELANSLELTNTTVTGIANATFQANGNTDDIGELNVQLRAEGQNVTINGRDAGQLSLTAQTNPGGRVDINLTTGITGKPQPFTASIELRRPGRPITIDANLADFNFEPAVAAFAPDLAASIAGTVNGRLHIAGPLVNEKDEITVDGLRGDLTLNNIALQVKERAINIQTPLAVTLSDAQVALSQTRISGQGIDLRLGGTIGLKENAALNFALSGTANLDALGQFDPDTFVGGTLKIDARLTGTASEPNLAGEIIASNLSFTGIDLPVSIENGNGRIALAGDRVTLENFTATANEGTLSANGSMTLAQLKPKEWNFVARASNVDVLYQGAQAIVNGDFNLTGNPDRQVLSGTVTIPEGEYTTNLDLTGLTESGGSGSLSFGSGSTTAGNANTFFPSINLDVRVDAPSSLLVRNQQINTVASAALTIGGTLDDPSVTGRVSIEGGTIKLRSQRYEITTGTLDFPIGGASPIVNILTEGDVSGYHVYLGLEGPIDAMEVTLRADPDLPRSEILSLVATGKTDSSTLGSEEILASGLGTAASLLSEEFISAPAQSLLGLSRFQIDPVLQPNTNPAARLTLGKQLTRDLAFTYSTNVGSEQDQSAIVEYTLTNKFSALASYTQGGSVTNGARTNSDFTLEVRGRRRFSLGFNREGNGAGKTTANEPPRIERAPKPEAQVVINFPEGIKLSDRRQRELLPVKTAGFSRPLARLGERNLANYLQERGYFFATVRSRCEPADCSGTGLKLIYDVQPGARYDLDDIQIEGTDEISFGDVSSALQSKSAAFFGGVPLLKNMPLIGGLARGITSDDRIRRDRETIRARLADLGFRSARVTSRIDTKPNSDDMVLVFIVEEGARSTVADITFQGNTMITAEELRENLPIKAEDAFSPTEARQSNQRIKAMYAEKGFLETTVQYAILDVEADRVMLQYNIVEGTRSVIAEIEVTGHSKTHENSIRRFFDFKPGEVLTPDKIRRTQRDLFATGAFSEVSIRPLGMSGKNPDARIVNVRVTEAKPLLMVYGLGYSTDEGPRGLLQFTNTNLFGRINSASIRLRASFREQLAQVQYIDPRVLGSKWGGTVSAFFNRNSNLQTFLQRRLVTGGTTTNNGPGFGINRFVTFAQAERKLSDLTSMRFRYSFESTKLFNVQNIPVDEIARNAQAVRLGQLSAGLTRDTRNSALNPTSGQLISFEHSLAARPLGGNEAFNKFFTNYQRYRQLPVSTPLLKDSVLAFAARVGLAAPYSIRGTGANGAITDADRQLPISARFFSGGATTLRGFQFEQAGPQAILEPRNEEELPTLVPLGGNALVVMNFELRYPLTTQLRLVPFYDLGNVFRRVSDIEWNGMSHTIGLGLRLNTPIGPVGIDYGYLLNPSTFLSAGGMVIRQPQGVIHIRFGQTF
ncbi:MAG: translocation/assembly module TamB domain-containing protein [Acidobacteriota bacterium]